MPADFTFRQGEYRATDYTPTVDVAAGKAVVLTDTVGISHLPIAANTLGILATSGGIYRGPKAAGSAIALGVLVYYDATNNVVTATSTSNKQLGYCAKAALSADLTVEFEHLPA